MENCPHIIPDILKEIREHSFRKFTDRQDHLKSCTSCNSQFYPFYCITCTFIGCTENAHSRLHFNKTGHPFAMNLSKNYIYCFYCEKYIKSHIMKPFIEFRLSMKLNTNNKNLENLFNDDDKNGINNITRLQKKNNKVHMDTTVLKNINEKLYKKYPCVIVKGFANLGNTCYLNSLLSILIYMPEFKDYFLGNNHRVLDCKTPDCILCGFKIIYSDLYSKSQALVLHNFVLRLARKDKYFIGSSQHDVHELFIRLINLVNVDLTDEENVLSKIFKGKNVLKFTCKKCKFSFEHQDTFYNLSVTYSESVKTSVNKFYTSEDVNDLSCEKCESLGFERIYLPSELPEIIVIHINRFEFKNKKGFKIDGNIINDAVIKIGSTEYKIYGIIIHKGEINDGHYKSIVTIDGVYRMFNDEHVTNANMKEIENSGSYMIFYSRI